jgi:pyruvate dehydrogenase E2 component (dihydrolipoamide acetyltransferase)
LNSSTTERPADVAAAEDAPTVDVTMPETGSEAGTTLVAWLVEPGQPVVLDEPICLVSWNGTTAEVGSPATGVLRMLSVGAGVRVPTGTSLALIDTRLTPLPNDQVRDPDPSAPTPPPSDRVDGAKVVHSAPKSPGAAHDDSADVSAEALEAPPPDSSSPTQPVPEQLLRDAPVDYPREADLRTFYSPAVRRLAAELGVDLEEIDGTAANGRVTLRDVRAHARPACEIQPPGLKRRASGIESWSDSREPSRDSDIGGGGGTLHFHRP